MAIETGRNTRRVGTRTSPSSPEPLVEEIVPNSAWTEDHAHHFLLVDLPEFTKEEVELQVDSSTGRIFVKGERQTDEHKCFRFELAFPLPADSDMDNISGNFDSETEILHVYVPKRSSQEHRETDDEIQNVSNGNVERPQEIESDHEYHNAVNEERDHSPHDWGREKEEIKNENAHNIEGFSDGLTRRKLVQKHNVSRALVEVLMRNKGVVGTAIMAFSFGLYVSHKFHSWSAP
ncbi:uncharacterized protein LOC109812438 [Cajanus cajan]|uniref:SHSP domain-containing protein n=1 Tax=Cajanus cajan TaxID=3821 RepID=A0A151S7D8_CAJCA|nr:uncharacterized protein LOC109812438 [Cajanus cajan]KYP50712.1 hypothetical protein KK1_027529 [Cajanus cajan]